MAQAVPCALVDSLGVDDEIEDPEEETFGLFSHTFPSQNLGFVDPKSHMLELTVGGRDLSIHQSPSVLSSNRPGGTTGAVVWKITPPFASWISLPTNILWRNGILNPSSAVLELGCGVSAIVGLVLAPTISTYVLTDQSYVSKSVEQNLAENKLLPSRSTKSHHLQGQKSQRKNHKSSGMDSSARHSTSTGGANGLGAVGNVEFCPLDWETDVVTPDLTGSAGHRSFDVVVACDCIYNEALTEPFVQTCADVCGLRRDEELDLDHQGHGAGGAYGGGHGGRYGGGSRSEVRRSSMPTCCVVAQQLRDAEVFEMWLKAFRQKFRVWRVPNEELPVELREGTGYVVHVGFLRDGEGERERGNGW